jgi:hypothetical protein
MSGLVRGRDGSSEKRDIHGRRSTEQMELLELLLIKSKDSNANYRDLAR